MPRANQVPTRGPLARAWADNSHKNQLNTHIRVWGSMLMNSKALILFGLAQGQQLICSFAQGQQLICVPCTLSNWQLQETLWTPLWAVGSPFTKSNLTKNNRLTFGIASSESCLHLTFKEIHIIHYNALDYTGRKFCMRHILVLK